MAAPPRAVCHVVKVQTGWLVGIYAEDMIGCPLMLCNVCWPERVSSAEVYLLSF